MLLEFNSMTFNINQHLWFYTIVGCRDATPEKVAESIKAFTEQKEKHH